MIFFMSQLAVLPPRVCGTCYGVGECNAADMGDLYFSSWECLDCKGTGFANGKKYKQLVKTKLKEKS